MWSPQGWNMIFRRILFDWEIPIMIELFKLLESFQGIQPGEDYLWCHGHNKGRYRVKDISKQVLWRIKTSNGLGSKFGESKCHNKVACFTWLLADEAVLKLDNVAKRGIYLCNRCSLCCKDTETVKHLFLHCNFTVQLWQIFLNLRGISWSMPSKIDETLFCWRRLELRLPTEKDGG